ncbi:unnamed protein product [Coregonus sp. 'balchen']|nr:unnamed protein product [Coregonus sp. 'balchen']
MRYVSAYLLAVLSGNNSPSSKNIKTILGSVGIEAEDERLDKVVKVLNGKDVNEVIISGPSKLASVPAGGAVAAPSATGSAAAGVSPAAAEEKKEEKEGSDEDTRRWRREKTIGDMQERLLEAKRYRRRWGLRLYGVPEDQGENVKRIVSEICNCVAPYFPEKYMDMAVDVAHRIGKKQDPIGSRSIIIQFAFRTARDAVWKKAKESAFLKERKF